jgi:putative aldouronate transport system substrate-binding protein
MKQMARFLFVFMAMVLFSPALLLAGPRQQSQSTTGPAATVTGKLTIDPQYGEEKYYPKPATGWRANPKYPQQPPVSGVNEFPIVASKVNMRIAVPYYSYVTDYENNDLTKYMEELTNVHVVWELLPEVNPLEKINLMFSAGEALPDVFMGCNIPSTMLITLGTGGLILPLQDLIEQNSYNMKALFESNPRMYPVMLSADGNVYALGDQTLNEANKLSMRFWINKTFLDTLGMKMPTTTDEYYEYLKAVKTRDPNKNGRADEIPLVGATEGWHAEIDGFLMNAFAYNETSTDRDPINRRRVYVTNTGKIDVSYNKPEWKQGLEYLHKLYAEGLLASESFTLHKEELRGLVEYEGALIVGSLPNGGPHEFANTQGERRKNFVVLPPLKGPSGVQQIWYDEFAAERSGRYLVTRDSKIPDIAIKWVDYCYTEDFFTRNRYGVLGRDWKIPPAGTRAVDGGEAKYEEILRWGTPQNAYWGVNAPAWNRFASYMRGESGDPYELEYVLWNAYQTYLPYAFKRSVPRTLAFTTEEARRYAEFNRLIVEYVEQSLARFVTGDLDLNRDWNRYLSDLDRMGVNDLISITQAAFDRQWKKALGY